MKLHASVVEKIVYLLKTYGGYEDEKKLKVHLESLDLTVYERKTKGQEMVLVETSEYVKKLNGNS
jgi:hypothetical protein